MRLPLLAVLLLCACPHPGPTPSPRLVDPVVPGVRDGPVTSLGCEAGLHVSDGYCCAPAETWSADDQLCIVPVVEAAPVVSAHRRGERFDDPLLGAFYWIPGAEVWMMEHEVTQGQWIAVMGNNPSYFSDCGRDCPVEQVSWFDIQRFITALVAVGHPRYDLPDEYAWELAARANQNFLFAGSNNIDAVAWFGGNSDGMTHPVCKKQRNAYGLCDMTGNVIEWTNSLQSNFRIDRGGHFGFNVYDSRVEYRDGNDSAGRSHLLGFRLIDANRG